MAFCSHLLAPGFEDWVTLTSVEREGEEPQLTTSEEQAKRCLMRNDVGARGAGARIRFRRMPDLSASFVRL